MTDHDDHAPTVWAAYSIGSDAETVLVAELDHAPPSLADRTLRMLRRFAEAEYMRSGRTRRFLNYLALMERLLKE